MNYYVQFAPENNPVNDPTNPCFALPPNEAFFISSMPGWCYVYCQLFVFVFVVSEKRETIVMKSPCLRE